MMKKIIFAAVLLLLTGCATAVPVTPVPPSLSADLTEVEGQVLARPAAAHDFSPAEPVLTLPVYSQVETGEDGLARLDLSSGTIVRLSPMTLFTLEANQDQPAGLWTRIKLQTGEIWVILRGGTLEVETPAGVSAVRGSYMSTAFDASSGGTRVTCLEGHCQVQNENGTVDLTDGDAAVLPPDGGAPVKGKMTPEDYARWQEFNPEAAEVLPTATPSPTPQPTATPMPTVTPTPTQSAWTDCTVSTGLVDGMVNLRTCADLSCAVIGTVHEGELLQREALSGNGLWEKVLWQGQEGWIYSRYCH